MAQQDRVLFLARKQLHFDWFPFLDIAVKKRKRKKKIIAIVRNFSSNFFIFFFLFYIYISIIDYFATLLISLLQFRDRTGIDSRIFENGRNEGGVEKMRKKGNNQAIRGGQFWLKSFSCEIRAGGGGERLMRDNKFAPKINPPTSEPKPRRVYI